MAKILVPDYMGKQVRAGIRSLREQGDTIDLAWKIFPFRSAYVHNYFAIIPSEVNDEKCIEEVVSLHKKESYDFILPFGNTSFYAVSKHAEQLRSPESPSPIYTGGNNTRGSR